MQSRTKRNLASIFKREIPKLLDYSSNRGAFKIMRYCNRCGKEIQFEQGGVSKSGKLIPLDYPSGEVVHVHVFPEADK